MTLGVVASRGYRDAFSAVDSVSQTALAMFYGAHGAEFTWLLTSQATHYRYEGLPIGPPDHDVIATAGPELGFQAEFLYVVPIGTLLGAGFLAAWMARNAPRTWRAGFLRGSAIVGGYLPLIVVGLVVFLLSADRWVPYFGRTLLVAGVLMPGVLGGSGGLLATGIHRLQAETPVPPGATADRQTD